MCLIYATFSGEKIYTFNYYDWGKNSILHRVSRGTEMITYYIKLFMA